MPIDQELLTIFMRSTVKMAGAQELFGDNGTVHLDEGLMATVKDPLWFLSRQWQMGEFEAEDGGSPASIVLEYSSDTPETIRDAQGAVAPLDPRTPWEAQIEGEANARLTTWSPERLEYSFDLTSADVELTCAEHHARRFDWFSFDVERQGERTDAPRSQVRFTPATLSFKGMPYPRWWQLESGETFLESEYDPEPNALSMILAEYVVTDANNWFLSPLPLDVGALHTITGVRVVDAFGVTTNLADLNLAPDSTCRLFCLSGAHGGLLIPNTGNEPMGGDTQEEVLLIRDEDANVVWAVEKVSIDGDSGLPVSRGGGADLPVEAPSSAPRDAQGNPIRAYQVRSPLARNWVPYIPIRYGHGQSEQVYFRRARLSAEDRAYETSFVAQSWRILEEEVPRYGVRVQRLDKVALDGEGGVRFWSARRKEFGYRHPTSGLAHDRLNVDLGVDHSEG